MSYAVLNSKLPFHTLPNPDLHTDQDALVIDFVTQLIQNALEKYISDIHIEPYDNHYRIRFRLDGLLTEVASIDHPTAHRVIMRIKILAELNIAEKRLPQDGRLTWYYNQNKFDIRISTCPTIYGEKLVLRLLNRIFTALDWQILGFSDAQKNLFLEKLYAPQGLILITGPTGCGKSITLYAALNHLNQMEKNIISVEDPVELELHGINQINVNPKIGLDFATALRGCLRQDPDIIMVGEIRDAETAAISVQAAQTGHLVLSTLHTNSAHETMIRLQSLQIAERQLLQSISLIISQRLIRRLCPHCKKIDTATHFIQKIKIDNIIYAPGNCQQCRDGYLGRIGIYEAILFEKNVNLSASVSQIFLWDAAIEKLNQGITSVAEILRVLGPP